MRRVGAVTVLTLMLAAPAHASLIGDAHHAINTQFQSRLDGFAHGRITACRHRSRSVDCDVLLTDPLPSCQGGTMPTPVSVAVCEAPQLSSVVVTLRVRGGRVYRLAHGSRSMVSRND